MTDYPDYHHNNNHHTAEPIRRMESSTNTHAFTADEPKRAKRLKRIACTPCRTGKHRCDGKEPMCGRCETRGLDCRYEAVPEEMNEAAKKYKQELKRRRQLAASMMKDMDEPQVSSRSNLGKRTYDTHRQDQPARQGSNPYPQMQRRNEQHDYQHHQHHRSHEFQTHRSRDAGVPDYRDHRDVGSSNWTSATGLTSLPSMNSRDGAASSSSHRVPPPGSRIPYEHQEARYTNNWSTPVAPLAPLPSMSLRSPNIGHTTNGPSLPPAPRLPAFTGPDPREALGTFRFPFSARSPTTRPSRSRSRSHDSSTSSSSRITLDPPYPPSAETFGSTAREFTLRIMDGETEISAIPLKRTAFESGCYGWSAQGRLHLPIDGENYDTRLSVNAVVSKSDRAQNISMWVVKRPQGPITSADQSSPAPSSGTTNHANLTAAASNNIRPFPTPGNLLRFFDDDAFSIPSYF